MCEIDATLHPLYISVLEREGEIERGRGGEGERGEGGRERETTDLTVYLLVYL